MQVLNFKEGQEATAARWWPTPELKTLQVHAVAVNNANQLTVRKHAGCTLSRAM